MTEDYTVTRIRRDVLQRLKAIAEREKRTVASQIAYMVEREEASAVKEPVMARPAKESQE